jgi:hypothetical protein
MIFFAWIQNRYGSKNVLNGGSVNYLFPRAIMQITSCILYCLLTIFQYSNYFECLTNMKIKIFELQKLNEFYFRWTIWMQDAYRLKENEDFS